MKVVFFRYVFLLLCLFSLSNIIVAQTCTLTDLFVLPFCDDDGNVSIAVTFYGNDEYNLADGNNTYENLTQGMHTFDGYSSGNNYTITISDKNDSNCVLSKDVMAPSCSYKCHSKAGILMPNTSTKICENGRMSVDCNGFTLSDHQTLYYLYHTAGDNLSNEDFPLNAEDVVHFGNFLDNTDTLSGKLWVTSFVAQERLNNLPDYGDPCFLVSNTIEVDFLDPVEISHTANCDEVEGVYEFDLVITGGMPQVDNSVQYDVSSHVYSGMLNAEQQLTVGPIPNGSTYDIFVSDLNYCTAQSSIYMVNCNKILPIELMAFEGEALADGNLIKWITASELENDYFIIQKSEDGINFDDIHQEMGNGTVNITTSYSFIDRNNEGGISYYKLIQTDFDGTTSDMGTIQVERGESQGLLITGFYPTISSDIVNFSLINENLINVSLDIINLTGQVEKNYKYLNVESVENQMIEIGDLSPGLYYANFQTNNFSDMKVFLKK